MTTRTAYISRARTAIAHSRRARKLGDRRLALAWLANARAWRMWALAPAIDTIRY